MKWQIGDVEIIQIVEMEAGELIQYCITNANPENIKQIGWLVPDFADEEGHLKALVQSFLIRSNGKNILVDTGNGNSKNRPQTPPWGNLNTDFLERLQITGIKEANIDYVICTHLHFDHVGWNTKLDNGEWIPTFPNAKYLFNKTEYEYWSSKPAAESEDDKLAIDDSVSPIIEARLSELVDSDYKVDENIHLIPTPGHTPGHISIMIKSKGEKAIITGDFIHHPCQITHPEWTMIADSDSSQALETRMKVLHEIVDTDTLLIGTHFANPVAGYLRNSDQGFIFKVNKDD